MGAIAKKGRLNILRIYRRNNKNSECNKITMICDTLIENKLGKTKNICQRGGNKNQTQISLQSKQSKKII